MMTQFLITGIICSSGNCVCSMRTLTENEIRQRKKYMTTEIGHATTRYQEKTIDTSMCGTR